MVNIGSGPSTWRNSDRSAKECEEPAKRRWSVVEKVDQWSGAVSWDLRDHELRVRSVTDHRGRNTVCDAATSLREVGVPR